MVAIGTKETNIVSVSSILNTARIGWDLEPTSRMRGVSE